MRYVLVFVLLVSTGAFAQNVTSQKFLAFSEPQRNTVWTTFIIRSGEKCDRVVRSMFQGGHRQLGDTWSVGCADGNEYSVGIQNDADGSTRLMTCKELIA